MNVESWTLREAGPGDAAALSLVASATFLETYAGLLARDAMIAHCAAHNSAEAFARNFAEGVRAWLVEAAEGGAPIGFALLTKPDLPSAGKGDLELKRIYSLSRFHGSGIGAALMDVAVTAAADHERLLLGVYRGNARALSFYRKQGFEPVATRQFNVGGTLYDDLVLARPIHSLSPIQGS